MIARFESERQALALMEHPNIARILDAGATQTGRPYFVMELVRGVPVTQFCQEKQLDLQSAPQSLHRHLLRRATRASERDHPP